MPIWRFRVLGSATPAAAAALACIWAGSLSRTADNPPIFCSCASWSRKSERSNALPLLIFLASFSAFS